MSLEKANITWSAKQLAAMIKNGTINLNHIIQRSYAWEKKRRSGLIESMILGYPVPPIYAKRGGEKKHKEYYVMDGKQRIITVPSYIKGEFALTEIPPVTYIDPETQEEMTEDISGKFFSELPKGLQDIINDFSFSVVYFDNLTKDEERELFKRLNAGKPLTAKNKALASCIDIEAFINVGEHDLFEEMLNNKAKDNKNQITLIMKTWCMLNQDLEEVSFESRKFNPILEKTVLSDDDKVQLSKIFDYILNTHTTLNNMKKKNVAKNLYTETHFISLIPYVKTAIEDGISNQLFAEWLVEFFDCKGATSISDNYNKALQGTTKNITIVNRHLALGTSFNRFFEDDNNVENNKDADDDSIDESQDIATSETENNSDTEENPNKTLDEESKDNTEENLEKESETIEDNKEDSEVQ